MKVRLTALDREIQQIEQRIADDRAAFVAALSECGHSVRETVSSPKSLLAVAGLGFVAGRMLFRPGGRPRAEPVPSSPSKVGGLLGVLAAGLSLLQPNAGALGLARWAAQQYWDRKKKNGQTAVPIVPRGRPPRAAPEVRMPPRVKPAEPRIVAAGR